MYVHVMASVPNHNAAKRCSREKQDRRCVGPNYCSAETCEPIVGLSEVDLNPSKVHEKKVAREKLPTWAEAHE